jgi:quercetin dioxygenase-like cupin family protein
MENRLVAWAIAAVALAGCRHQQAGGQRMGSRIVGSAEGTARQEPWGHWLRRLHGDTAAVSNLTISLFTLAPGQAPHPPHQHAEEELMILVEGGGTWHLVGKDSPAHQGDVVYAAPWDIHGLRNTGTVSLSYYVLKWAGRGR